MLYLHRGSVRSCTFSPDGRWFATGSSRGELRLWDLASASSVWRTKAHAVVHRVRFSADGERLVTCGYQGGVRLWSRDSGALVGELGESTKHTDCIDLSADGQRLLALRGERMTVFDLGRGQSYVREPRPDAALFGGYGDEIYLLGYCFERFEYRQSVIDAETGQLRREWPNAARCQAFDSEHRRLVSAGLGNTLRLWDSESGALLAQGEGLCELLEVFVVGRFVVGLSPIGGLHFFSLERLESVDPELPWLGQGA